MNLTPGPWCLAPFNIVAIMQTWTCLWALPAVAAASVGATSRNHLGATGRNFYEWMHTLSTMAEGDQAARTGMATNAGCLSGTVVLNSRETAASPGPSEMCDRVIPTRVSPFLTQTHRHS